MKIQAKVFNRPKVDQQFHLSLLNKKLWDFTW